MYVDNTNVTRKRRRILSLDGGGILGTFPAAFLAGIEENLKRPIGEYFDLIAGTSTGGIIAIGLGMGLRASEIRDLYMTRGPEIFGQAHNPVTNFLLRHARVLQWLYRPKYDSEKLANVLIDTFGDRRLGHATQRLIIPAWNPVARSVHIYKTPHHKRLCTDYKALAVDVALATAAAPAYFQQHTTEHHVGLIDGGVWANNPAGIAVVEAIGLLGWPADGIDVLSLGCLEETYTISGQAGLSALALKVVKLFMDGQSKGALGIAKVLTGHEHERKAVYRVDYTVPSKINRLDDARLISKLIGLGNTAARERFPVLKSVFFESPAEPFNPNYKLENSDAL